jgi:hypothetical protein
MDNFWNGFEKRAEKSFTDNITNIKNKPGYVGSFFKDTFKGGVGGSLLGGLGGAALGFTHPIKSRRIGEAVGAGIAGAIGGGALGGFLGATTSPIRTALKRGKWSRERKDYLKRIQEAGEVYRGEKKVQ